jgi:hypothetical protein
MPQRLVLALSGCFLALAASADGRTSSPSRPAAPPDTDSAHFVLVFQCSANGTRPRNLKEWEELLRGRGLRSPGTRWTSRDRRSP